MQKIASLLIAAVMVATGLVVATTSPASAGRDCYGGLKDTYTTIEAPATVKRWRKARITVTVSSDSNGTPKGKVLLRVRRQEAGFFWGDVKRLTNGNVRFRTPRLKKTGDYTVIARFERKAGSCWKDSDGVAEFTVVPARRPRR
ncbi:hypothetical protein ACFP3Q_17925 [Nocardioides sp. GCM10027113]|uniref:hypothetical protein n=1 Tax=unclassified Nocardioides TaxID=2615069 RepID=UPI00360C2C15